MEKSESQANSIRPMRTWKIVMKNLSNLATGSCLLACMAFSAAMWGQAPDTNQSGPAPDAAETTAPPAQPDQASKGPHADATYIIGDDDVLAINVWKELELTRLVTVRSDGRISLPLAGEVQAAGRTPSQLEQEITSRLRGFITDPQVTVIVQETKSQKFNVLGQVVKPGSYPFTTGTTVVDAVATAGGFKDFAKRKSIYVLRQKPGGGETRISFNYDKFIKVKKGIQNVQLEPGDTLVVP
jgi:polysaccharide export outer membrane protein